MDKPKAHVSEKKKKEVIRLNKLLKEYPVVGLVDITGLPSPQLQRMRKSLKDSMLIYVSKKRLISIVLDQSKDIKGLSELKNYLRGMPCLILSKENPFKLSKTLRKSKSSAPAKPGQIVPNDIMIPKGPTGFAPGPVISELSSVGLKTSVEAGKIVIKEDKLVAKEGDIINQKLADVLARLKIEPMEVGLNISAILEKGIIYDRDILSIDESQYLRDITTASRDAFALALDIGYITKDNVDVLIKKAYNDAKVLALETKFVTDENVSEVLSKTEQEASVIKDKIEKGESLPKKEEPKADDKPKEEIKEKSEVKVKMEPEVKEEVQESEAKKEEVKEETKQPENIVEETIEKVKTGEPIKEKVEGHQGPDKELIQKTEDFVKQLTDGKIAGDEVDYRKSAKDKKKKEKEDKEFKEAEKKAQEVLKKL